MKNKKAFTVVELVIVIAIIAILAAVLIPTFANIIKKANVSKDQQLIRNLNTALASDKAENGGKAHANMTEALEAAKKFGYEVGKINASGTDNEILWDSKNDVFCYYDADKQSVEYIPSSVSSVNAPAKESTEYWCIITEKNVDKAFATNGNEATLSCGRTDMKWSCYLDKVASGVDTITTSTGVDVGETTEITTINYVNNEAAQSVIVRTHGGTLLVGSSSDIAAGQIYHYGTLDTAVVYTEMTCFHTHGTIKRMELMAGKAIAEENGIIYLMKAESATAAFEENGGIVIVPAGTATTDIKATENSTLAESLTQIGYSISGEAIVMNESKNSQIGTSLFAGGSGTKTDPFILKTTEHIQNISELYQSLDIVENDANSDYSAYAAYRYGDTNIYIFEQPSTKGLYYKIADGVTQLDCSNWTPVYLYGSFDGNNCKFVNLDQTFFAAALNYYNYGTGESETCEISNCDFDVKVLKTASAAPIVFSAGPKVKFSNVSVSGRVEGQYISSFVGFGVGQFAWKNASYNPCISADYEFVNCRSTATLTCVSIGEGQAAGFFAHIYSGAGSTVKLTNSTYEGRMNVFTATTNGLYINCMGSATITMDEASASKLKVGTTNQYSDASVHIIAGNKNGTVNGYNAITEDAVENAAYAIATYMIGTKPGGIQGAYITERIELDGNTFTSVNAHKYDVVIDKTDSYFYKIDGNTIKLGRPDCTGINTNYIVFNQYDSSGNLLSSVMYAFGDVSTVQE